MREKHGGRHTRLYTIWIGMKARCQNENDPAYPNYGGRGIEVCDEWRASFLAFRRDMGDPPDGMSLERVNNDLGYSRENCVWATRSQQSRNRRSNRKLEIDGVIRLMTDWATLAGLPVGTVWSRLKAGWTPKDAVFKPFTPHHERALGRRKMTNARDLGCNQ